MVTEEASQPTTHPLRRGLQLVGRALNSQMRFWAVLVMAAIISLGWYSIVSNMREAAVEGCQFRNSANEETRRRVHRETDAFASLLRDVEVDEQFVHEYKVRMDGTQSPLEDTDRNCLPPSSLGPEDYRPEGPMPVDLDE